MSLLRINMLRIILYSLTFLSVIPCFGLSFCSSCKGDTSNRYQTHNDLANRIGLPDLTTSTDSLHFRFWSGHQAIDIWTNDFVTFNGLFANYTRSADMEPPKQGLNIPKEGKFYSSVSPIDTATAKQIYKLFTGDSILSIPTYDSIPGWSGWIVIHGNFFSIEHFTSSEYSIKEYLEPSAFKK